MLPARHSTDSPDKMTDFFRDIEVFDVKELAKLCGGNFDADKLAEESGVDFTSARVLHQRTPYESLRSKLFPDVVFKVRPSSIAC